MFNLKLKLHKLLNWEYWPMPIVYLPISPIWLFYTLKAKSFFYFNAANPSIKNGGMAMESKKEIYDLLPKQYYPQTLFFKSDTKLTEVASCIFNNKINFPLIAKPDIGMKGFGVQIINNTKELYQYLNKNNSNFLVQELITYKNEVGIFYCRIPSNANGEITGIVSKDFLSITGNGNSTVNELIKENPRCLLQIKALEKIFPASFFETILEPNKKVILVPYGSHTRGSQFNNITNKLDEKLYNTFNNICKNIQGFYYGRLDIMYDNWEDLCNGKNFSIIELNGAGSEPTHIYDPKQSLFFAWKEIIKHWKLLYKISAENNFKGVCYMQLKEGIEMFRANKKLEKKLKALH